MAAATRAPKQWSLTKNETINSFENWRQNLLYTLSLDATFAPFVADGVVWRKRTRGHPRRGFLDDDNGPTAEQKVRSLELMLGQIANYCPVIARSSIIKDSTSLNSVWHEIRQHFGFQVSGAQFLDFDGIHLEGDERPEDLFQRLKAFLEDTLLRPNGLTHHGERVAEEEEVSPTLENMLVLTWLRLGHPGLPKLVKQRYGTELRSRTLASIKPEISQALSSLLDELRASDDVRGFRSAATSEPRRTAGGRRDPRLLLQRR